MNGLCTSNGEQSHIARNTIACCGVRMLSSLSRTCNNPDLNWVDMPFGSPGGASLPVLPRKGVRHLSSVEVYNSSAVARTATTLH